MPKLMEKATLLTFLLGCVTASQKIFIKEKDN